MDVLRSPFFYVGDKYKLIPQIKKEFPKQINRFIEPFCGGGSVFLNIDANRFVLNDIDTYMIKLHEFLFDYRLSEQDFFEQITNEIKKYRLSASFIGQFAPKELKKQYVKTYYAQYNKESFLQMRKDYNQDKDNLILLYLLLIYGFNRMLRFNSSGDFNLPVGNVDFNKNVENALRSYFACARNKNTIFENQDFGEFIKNVNPQKDDFIYLDPPYLITFSEYNKLWNEEQEVRLIKLLDDLNGVGVRFVISNILWHKRRYNAIFNEWAQKYDIVKISSNYISYHDNTDKNSYEVLVKNY